MKRYVGIDVGGTKIEGVLVNESLQVFKRIKAKTEAHKSREDVIENIAGVINQLRTDHVDGIGVGTPGFMDASGRMEIIPNLPQFEKFALKKALEKKLVHEIFFENDANCFIIAEHRAGAAMGMKNVLGITLGTGVGGGAIIDGKLLRGRDGGAAHFGQLIIHPSPDSKCHQDLEWWCGGRNIEERFLKRTGKKFVATQIFESDDPEARRIVEEVYHRLAIGFADLISLFNPEGIVLGGSIARDINSAKLKKEIDSHGQRPLTRDVKNSEKQNGSFCRHVWSGLRCDEGINANCRILYDVAYGRLSQQVLVAS